MPTEDDILGTIPGLDSDKGQSNDTASEVGDDQEVDTSAQNTARQQSDDGEENSADQRETSPSTNRNEQQQTTRNRTEQNQTQQTTGQGRVDPASDFPRWKVDDKGNVIIPAGADRRQLEQAIRYARTEGPKLKSENDALRRQVQAFETANTAFKQFDLTPQEVVTAHQLVHGLKTDPLGTIQALLTEAKARGINVDTGSSAIDAAAIKKMVAEQLQPFNQDRERALKEAETQQRVRQEYDAFMARFPDAAPHVDTLGALLEQHPELSPEAAYYELQLYYQRRGLDWRLPLEQATAIQADKPNQQGRNNGNRNLSGGRGNYAPQGRNTEDNTTAETPTDMIVRQAMREHGINIE